LKKPTFQIHLEELNPQQRHAVHTVDGRVLILAGAGSGKTKVLTMRMVHLIANLQVSPKQILGLTFTNKAAAEMRHRIASLMDPSSAKQVTLCTFHSFCMNILRAEIHRLGYTNQFSLYNEKDVQRLISHIARDLLDHEGELPSLSATTSAINHAKNRGLTAEQIENTGSEWHDGFTKNIYTRLQESMRAYNAVDFDNLLGLTVELFEKHPDILDRYQERYRYIMIDEYQDTNPIQYRLAALLASKYKNLCVVGDDDQSIYGWRGADVKNILEFDCATVIKLEQNYRSTNRILKSANAVISNNTKRHPKVLWSERGEGFLIEVFHAPNEVNEAEAVVCRIAKLKKDHDLHWRDIAILYRSNALSRQFELALMKHSWHDGETFVRGIPYQVFGGVEFYERKEVKDLCAYLRVILNPLDQEALLRVINQPRRGIGEGALDSLTAYNRSRNIPLWDVLKNVIAGAQECEHLQKSLTAKGRTGIETFVNTLELGKKKFADSSMHEGIKWLIEKINYKKAIEEEVKSPQMRTFKWENVEEFVTAVAEYEKSFTENSENIPSLQDFMGTISLDDDWNKRAKGKSARENKVNLLTLHSAKGLEFPACFLVGMEDHIIPHEKSLKETGIEEERRLMYVGITRAMKYLTISMAQQRKRMGQESSSRPSRFLFEIPKEMMKITQWHELS
jgi:DNA helicase II / ATP-dependent DNA helicase PcrA